MAHYRFVALAACAALSLAACTTPGVGPVPQPGAGPVATLNHTLADERAMASAELAYNQAAQVYITALEAGVLTPARKAQAKAALAKTYDALKAARSAYDTFNATSFQAQVQAVLNLAGQTRQLLPPPKPG